MALTTAKLSELPLKTTLPLTSHSSTLNLIFFSRSRLSFRILRPLSALRTAEHRGSKNPRENNYSYPWDEDRKLPPKSNSSSAPWLNKWPNAKSSTESTDRKSSERVAELYTEDPVDHTESRYFDKDKGKSAIERIVLRLRNLGIGSDDEEEEEEIDAGK